MEIGDRVSVLIPGSWERRGVVIETDLHPLGIGDSVKVKFDDGFDREPTWWDVRWVKKES